MLKHYYKIGFLFENALSPTYFLLTMHIVEVLEGVQALK